MRPGWQTEDPLFHSNCWIVKNTFIYWKQTEHQVIVRCSVTHSGDKKTAFSEEGVSAESVRAHSLTRQSWDALAATFILTCPKLTGAAPGDAERRLKTAFRICNKAQDLIFSYVRAAWLTKSNQMFQILYLIYSRWVSLSYFVLKFKKNNQATRGKVKQYAEHRVTTSVYPFSLITRKLHQYSFKVAFCRKVINYHLISIVNFCLNELSLKE